MKERVKLMRGDIIFSHLGKPLTTAIYKFDPRKSLYFLKSLFSSNLTPQLFENIALDWFWNILKHFLGGKGNGWCCHVVAGLQMSKWQPCKWCYQTRAMIDLIGTGHSVSPWSHFSKIFQPIHQKNILSPIWSTLMTIVIFDPTQGCI